MRHLTSWMTTLPIMVIGMLGIVLVIGVIVLAVMLLNRLTGRKRPPIPDAIMQKASGCTQCAEPEAFFVLTLLRPSPSGRRSGRPCSSP